MTTSSITLTIPGPPVGKARARRGKYGHFYTPERTREYEQDVRWEFINKYAGMAPWEGPVTLLVKAHVKTPTAKPDGSNILKLIEDALNRLAYKDDAQVVDARVVKVKAGDGRTLRVEIHAEGS